MKNEPKILSNDLDQVPKTWERYEKELNKPEVHDQIIETFDKIMLEWADFSIGKSNDVHQNHKDKKLSENWDIRETNSNGVFFQKFTFDAAKREVEKAGKKLLPSAKVFQDIFMNTYKWDRKAFIVWENLTVTDHLIDETTWWDLWPWFLYIFADWSIFAMYNTNLNKEKKEDGFFGIYNHNANETGLKDYLFSIRLAK